MSKSMPQLGVLVLVLLSSVLVVSGAAWIIANLNEGDPAVSLPEEISPDESFTVVGLTDDPPVQIEVTNKATGAHLPGSPDTGADTPGGINTLDTNSNGMKSGDVIQVKVTNRSGHTKTVTIQVQ